MGTLRLAMTRKTPPAPAPAATPASPGRRRLFLVITLLVPLLLAGAAEGLLRLTGVGALEPLFVPVEAAPGFLQPNPAAVQRFFPDPRRAPDVSIDTTWFPAAKAPGTLRIFVQGESSAAGFPYGRWASPAALLQQRLQRAYPDRNVEVINTGMAAVTSYVLLDFADEIIAMQPDAVVVYAGHNEYLGIGGVGSSLASARSPTLARGIVKLRRLHLYRALERAFAIARVRRRGSARGARRHADVTRRGRALDPARLAAVRAGTGAVPRQSRAVAAALPGCRRAGLHRHAREQRARPAAFRECPAGGG